jgi:hypothetical protein
MQRFWLAKRNSLKVEGPYDGATIIDLIRQGQIRAWDRINETTDERFWFDAGLLVMFPRVTCRYHDWLWCLRFNTVNAGPKAAALVAATVSVTIASVIAGLHLFPPGTYLKIALAAPGILTGLVFLYVFGAVLFKVPNWLALLLSCCATVAGIAGIVWMIRLIFGTT